MAIDYAHLALVAQRLINDNGRSLTITLRSRAPADPTKPWNGPSLAANATTTINVVGVIGMHEEYDPHPDLVRSGDKQAYISALDTDPSLVEHFDILDDGDDRWKIDKVDLIAPGPTRVIYLLKLRS